MRERVGHRSVLRALKRLPRHAHLGPSFEEDGSLFLGTPYRTVDMAVPGVYFVAKRTQSMCDATRVGQLRTVLRNRLHRLERCASKRLFDARLKSAAMRLEDERKRKEQTFELLMGA